MQRAAAERRWSSLHEARPYHDGTFRSWRKEPDDQHPFRFDDGVTIWVTDGEDPSPDDQFLAVESPGPPAGSSSWSEDASPMTSPSSPNAPKK